MDELDKKFDQVVPLFWQCRWSHGPDPQRDDTCTICCEVIKPEALTIGHQGDYDIDDNFIEGCRNRWCKKCFVLWALSNRPRKVPCPNCRKRLRLLDFGIYDDVWGTVRLLQPLKPKLRIFGSLQEFYNFTNRYLSGVKGFSLQCVRKRRTDYNQLKARLFDNMSVLWQHETAQVVQDSNRGLYLSSDDLFTIWQLSRLRGVSLWRSQEWSHTGDPDRDTTYFLPSQASRITIVASVEFLKARVGEKAWNHTISNPARLLQLPIPTNLLNEWRNSTDETWPKGKDFLGFHSDEPVTLGYKRPKPCSAKYWCIIDIDNGVSGADDYTHRVYAKPDTPVKNLWAVEWPEGQTLGQVGTAFEGWNTQRCSGARYGWDEATDDLMIQRFLTQHGTWYWK